MIGREDEVREYRVRAKRLNYIIFVGLLLIIARLFYLQVLRGDELRKYSEANRLKKEKLFPTRGFIFDRNGRVIVDSRASFDVVLLSQYYPHSSEMNQRLAKVLQMRVEDLEARLLKASRTQIFYPVLLKADVTKELIAAIEMDADGFPGVDIEATVQRRYPYGELAAQVLGYVGEVDKSEIQSDRKGQLQLGDYIGRAGIEKTFDSDLRGTNGVGYVEVDSMGRRRKRERGEELLGFVTQTEPIPGNNLYLTIDLDLELVAAKAMVERKFNGSVIALDPRSGELLAMVNFPSYHPERISGREVDSKIWEELSGDKHGRPLRNRALQDIYPPGSTFKLFVAMAALAEGVATPKTSFHCHGKMPFGNRFVHCWKKHGAIDFIRAIKESCDVFFYNMGIGLGVDRIAKYARLFGLGDRTGIAQLSNEQRGLIPDSEWKMKRFKESWQPGETLSVAIGQGYVSLTPLQLVTAYAAIGNGGFVYRPYLVRKIEGRGGGILREFQPLLKNKIEVPSEVFEVLKEGLFKAMNEPGGTSFASRSKKTVISGKTGTAQIRGFSDIMKKKCENLEPMDRHHGWFVGYAPRENPKIAVVALAEHSCHGSRLAPVVRDVIEAYLEKVTAEQGLVRREEGQRPEASEQPAMENPHSKRGIANETLDDE